MLFKKTIVNILSGALILSFSTSVIAKNSSKTTKALASQDKIFEDWRVSCSKDEKTKKNVCIAQQTITVEQDKKNVPLVTYQFSKDKKDLKIVYLLPQGILLEPGVAIIAGEKILTKSNFKICQNNICVASGLVPSKDLKQILSIDVANVGIFNSEGKQVNLTMSTKGLKKALDSL